MNEEMRCPGCGLVMAELESPGVQLAPVNEAGKEYPVRVVANIIKLYGCVDCNIKAVKTSPLEYYPKVEVAKETIEEPNKCCDTCNADVTCNCEGDCKCGDVCDCDDNCNCNTEDNGQDKHL